MIKSSALVHELRARARPSGGEPGSWCSVVEGLARGRLTQMECPAFSGFRVLPNYAGLGRLGMCFLLGFADVGRRVIVA